MVITSQNNKEIFLRVPVETGIQPRSDRQIWNFKRLSGRIKGTRRIYKGLKRSDRRGIRNRGVVRQPQYVVLQTSVQPFLYSLWFFRHRVYGSLSPQNSSLITFILLLIFKIIFSIFYLAVLTYLLISVYYYSLYFFYFVPTPLFYRFFLLSLHKLVR